MRAFRAGAPRWLPLAAAAIVLAGLAGASLIASLAWRAQLREDVQVEFDDDVVAVQNAVEEQLDSLEQVTGAVQAGAAGADGAGGAVADAVSDAPAGLVISVALVEQIPDDRLAAALAEADQLTPRNLAETDQHLLTTVEETGRLTPALLGLDLASLPRLREALADAEELGESVLTERLNSLPADTVEAYPELGRSGFALVAPLVVTPEAAAPVGAAGSSAWVVVLGAADNLVDEAVSGGEIDVDAQLAGPGGVLASSATLEDGSAVDLGTAPDDARRVIDVERHHAQWDLTVADLDGLTGRAVTREPLLILVGGVVLAAVLAALVATLALTRASAVQRAERATDEMLRSEQHFRALVQNLSDLILVIDADRRITYASPSVRTLLGWDPEDTIGRPVLVPVHPDDQSAVRAALGSPDGSVPLEARVRHADGSYLYFEGVVTDLLDDSAVNGLVVTAHDVTQREAVERRLAHDATHDPLTRLPNRVLAHDRLEHALARAARDGSRAALIFCDLDNFKEINDERGHSVGDRVLVEAANRVRRAARAADTVARYGGDEFLVICEDVATVTEARGIAARIQQEMAEPMEIDGVRTELGVTVGLAMSGGSEESPDELVIRADEAMYEAKAAGRGRIEVSP